MTSVLRHRDHLMYRLLVTKQNMDLCKGTRSSHIILWNQVFLIDRGYFSESKSAESFVCFFVLNKIRQPLVLLPEDSDKKF